jgi:hypothetical protein
VATNELRPTITVDGETHIATTRWTQPSAHVLTAHTVIPQPPLAIEIHSTFVGHDSTPVHATHLLLGPIGADYAIDTKPLDSTWYHPGSHARACLDEHFVQIVDLLLRAGYDARLDTPRFSLA